MSEDQEQEIKELKQEIEIPVEEDGDQFKEGEPSPDVVAEFKHLGRQFAETIEAAWNSDERRRIEQDVREGVRSFAGEVDKVLADAKSSPASDRIREEGGKIKEQVDSTDLGRRARSGIVQGLAWMSEELGKLAEQFTAEEKSPDDTSGEAPSGGDESDE